MTMAQPQIEGTSYQTDDPHQEEKQRRYLRIFFLIIVALWILAAITLPVVAFCITKNPLCLTGAGIAALLPARYVLLLPLACFEQALVRR